MTGIESEGEMDTMAIYKSKVENRNDERLEWDKR